MFYELEMNNVNEKISIFEGDFTIKNGALTLQGSGEIFIQWLPSPQIRFNGKFETEGKKVKLDTSNPIYLETSNSIQFSTLVTLEGYGNPMTIAGVAREQVKFEGTDEEVDIIRFPIVNFINNMGDWISHEKVNFEYSGRLYFEIEDFEIRIDKIYIYEEIFKQMKNADGYCITHYGLIKRKDDASFHFNDVSKVMQTLIALLSFAAGRRVDMCYIEGRKDDKIVFKQYQMMNVDKWNSNTTWYVVQEPVNNLNHMLPKCLELMKEEVWERALTNILAWYFESRKSNTNLENKIVSIQIALESLAWTYIVEHRLIMKGNKFDKLTAAEKLRIILYTR